MDETGVLLSVLSSLKVLVSKDDLRHQRGADVKRTLVTAIECVSANGRSLDPLIIWPASTHRSNWTTHPTPGWYFAASKTGYTDKEISLYWIKNVFDPQTKPLAKHRPRVLINDGFATHESLELITFCFENNIVLCRLPSHTSHKLQPCDVGIFGPLKSAYREQVEQLYRGGANTVGKEHFTTLYSRARSQALTSRNIKAGWSKTGLVPFNPARVLGNLQPPQESPEYYQTESIHTDVPTGEAPLTTPVTAENLAALREKVEKETQTLNRDCQIRLQKAFNAAERLFAERAILGEENRLLFDQNNEKVSRTSARSRVVGNAKIMSYEDIVEAQRRIEVKETTNKKQPQKGWKHDMPAKASGKDDTMMEKDKGQKEIDVLGLKDFCSILHFPQ